MELFTVRAALAFGECRMFVVEADDLIGAAIKGQEIVDDISRRIKTDVDEDAIHEPHICEISECCLIKYSKKWLDVYVDEVKDTVTEESD